MSTTPSLSCERWWPPNDQPAHPESPPRSAGRGGEPHVNRRLSGGGPHPPRTSAGRLDGGWPCRQSPRTGRCNMLDSNSTRDERELWRKLAHGRARVLLMGHETDGTSPFKSLAEAYALSDEALVAAINGHPSAAVWP